MHMKFTRSLRRLVSSTHATQLLMVCCTMLLVGCGSLPQAVATRPASTQHTFPANVALLADAQLSQPIHSYTTQPANTFPIPYQYNFFEDIKPAVTESGFGSWFSRLEFASPGQEVQADFFLLPQIKVFRVDYALMGYNDTKMQVDLGVGFLDGKRALICEANSSGQAVFNIPNPKRTRQAAHVAFSDAFAKLSSLLTTDPQTTFVLRNKQFFNVDDAAKQSALPQLLGEAQATEKFGAMLLAYAIRGNYQKLLDGLLDRNVSPISPAIGEALPPLHLAALYNNTSAITKLVALGASLNSRDNENHLPIFYATWSDKPEATLRLLELNSDVDVFDSDLPVTSIQKIASFGDYYAAQWNKERAKLCYDAALKAASSSASELKTASAKTASKRRWATFAIIVAGAVQGAAQQMAHDVQAKAQARDFAQFEALKQANASGTGFAGYVSALHSANVEMNNLARDQSRIAAMQAQAQTLRFENQALMDSDLKAKEKALLKLSQQAEQEAALLRKKLAALDKVTNYDQFKQAIGNTE